MVKFDYNTNVTRSCSSHQINAAAVKKSDALEN